MSKTFKVSPNAGRNARFPEHRLVSSGKDKKQYCRELINFINLDGKFYIVGGASKVATNTLPGDIKWAKRIYYAIGGDRKRDQFVIAGGKFYKLQEDVHVFNQVTINNSLDEMIDSNFYPIDATIKVAEQVSTFLVDGTYFYKFNGNDGGNWDKLPAKTDVDGNTIKPIFIAEYLDRLWVLDKQRNVLIGSKNLNPEDFSDSTDSVLIELSPGVGGFPTGLIVHNGFLFIVHENYFVPLSGSSPATFGVRPGDYVYGYGTRAPRSIFSLKSAFGFLNSSDNEIYQTSGTLGSTEPIPLSYDIKFSELVNPVKADKTVIHLDTILNAIRVSYVLTGETLLNAEEIYSLNEEKWCGQTRGRYISCYCQWDGFGDNGEFMTGRSDVGKLMVNDSSLKFDDTAIHYRFVSASYVADEDNLVQFDFFEFDAKSGGNFGIPLSYYLDTRITTSGSDQINNQGEIINLGLIEIADQTSFLNMIKPLIDKRKGRMIRFQIEGTKTNMVLEFYGLNVGFTEENRIFSKYISGR